MRNQSDSSISHNRRAKNAATVQSQTRIRAVVENHALILLSCDQTVDQRARCFGDVVVDQCSQAQFKSRVNFKATSIAAPPPQIVCFTGRGVMAGFQNEK